ncbi:hypothetical protein [Pseudooceanicola sp. LIPI14-2-Ac024]|uniref:hypothetical protein n=1 Tax=Pseudooceanicola sp. LIPI14-2-Ac024 TaxID=3344875 RepID=UPI0035CF1E2D
MSELLLNLFLVAVALATGVLLWRPALRRMPTWRAMVTPLASIIGSGFLIVGPVLDHAFGAWAPAGMALLCLAAWAFGAAVRANIARIGDSADPRPAGDHAVETLAAAVLAFAYMISVAYYLNLFGAFAVSLTPWDTDLAARLVTSSIIVVILLTGWRRGFAALESLEYATVALKLAIIAALIAGLAIYFRDQWQADALVLSPASVTGWPAVTLVMGLLVTVQGFETSRYLGASYDAATRIRSMRWSQWLSSGIYMTYIVLMAYVFHEDEIGFSETAIIDMMAVIAPVLPLLLVAAALAAQFSAAVADTGGSGGLIAELSGHRVSPRVAYAGLAAVGLALTWIADIFQIVSYASRAFAAYYAVQAWLAARGARRDGQGLKAAGFLGLAILGLLIVVLGTPVEN